MKTLVAEKLTMQVNGQSSKLTFEKKPHSEGTFEEAVLPSIFNNGSFLFVIELVLSTDDNLIKNVLKGKVKNFWVMVETVCFDEDKNQLVLKLSPTNKPKNNDTAPDLVMELRQDKVLLTA